MRLSQKYTLGIELKYTSPKHFNFEQTKKPQNYIGAFLLMYKISRRPENRESGEKTLFIVHCSLYIVKAMLLQYIIRT